MLLFFTLINTYGQVGINTEDPNALTELEITNLIDESNNLVPKGIMIPRMSESQCDLIDVSDQSLANSLLIYNTDEDCYNYYSKIENEWQSLCGKLCKADFTIDDCSKIEVQGVYQNDVALTTANYLTIPVKVTKVGSYTINVLPNPANGYYFSTSGEFLSTGTYYITVPGAGTPVNYTLSGSDGDEIDITLNGISLNCSNKPKVKIEDSTVRPYYALSCNSISVNGIYKNGVEMTTDNTITMRIYVYAGAQGATYTISTNTIDGISFKGTGVLGSPGIEEVTLYAEGTVYSTAPKIFTINTNSECSTSTCEALVKPVIGTKKIMAAGSTTYGLTSGGDYGCGAMIKSNMNYGDNINSIIKYEGFTSVETATSLNNLATWVGNSGGDPYDIIIITYNLTPSAAQRALLVDYVNRGGVLIYLDQNTTANNVQMVGDIFGETISTAVSIGYTCNQVIKMNADIDDEISNGPFGDVRSGQWGEDYPNSCGLPVVPSGAIVYAGATNAYTGSESSTAAMATILRHPTKNFFWCGDSGLIHGGSSTSATDTPFWIGSKTINGIVYPQYPVDKPNYGYSSASLSVCNSTLFANVMAWALRMADENGINTGK